MSESKTDYLGQVAVALHGDVSYNASILSNFSASVDASFGTTSSSTENRVYYALTERHEIATLELPPLRILRKNLLPEIEEAFMT